MREEGKEEELDDGAGALHLISVTCLFPACRLWPVWACMRLYAPVCSCMPLYTPAPPLIISSISDLSLPSPSLSLTLQLCMLGRRISSSAAHRLV